MDWRITYFMILLIYASATIYFFEPSFESLVKEPVFFFQFYSCQVLLVCLLLIVKGEK